ncbi:MAG: ATP-dependent DNA helicase [Ruminococcaceae bacterium]|nr:ATP-dependent DNA helicase [Oscillospiraceae bacterium]
MSVSFLRENNSIHIPVGDLAGFAYPKENPAELTKQYGFIRDQIYEGFDGTDEKKTEAPVRDTRETDALLRESISRELPLEITAEYEGIPVTVSGTADIVAFDGMCHTVEKVKLRSFLPYYITPFDDPTLFAETACYAHMLACAEGLSRVRVRITFLKRTTGDRISWSASFSAKVLENLFHALINRAGPFLKFTYERAAVMPEEIVKCPFPFGNIREGQKDFVLEAFRTVKHGGSLFVSAPTGIGKTMASLYPAIKALGIGEAEKIFYLTSKTVTGLAALDAARALNRHIPHLRAVLVSAKEMQCPNRLKKAKDPVSVTCSVCGNRRDGHGDDGTFFSYAERQHSALLSLLYSDNRIYTTERITQTAEEYSVCPHELSLDLSLYCDIVVCDYNYAYDDSVRFMRYFKTHETQNKYVFLIDEAHNLPDRVREMYSASVTGELMDELLGICRGGEGEIPELCHAVESARDYLDTVKNLCREDEYIHHENGVDIPCGYYKNNALDDRFVKVFTTLSSALIKHINEGGDYAAELAPYKNIIRQIAFVCSFFNDKFCFFAEKIGESVSVDLMCLDPSEIISAMNRSAKAVIQFSATLSPMEYYKTVSGCPDAAELDLPSPYDRENLCLVSFDSISTRFSDRKDSAYETALVLAEAISAKEGNYIIYFSSYAHMKTVVSHFAHLMPEATLVMQRSGMSYKERERFISVFGDSRYRNVVGFCVLGGMFSEGIDLTGEKLIGAIIVGTGMPGLSAKRNIMMEYYERTTEKGREFAYIYPGMNKVLQAAGRVIRSENDRGMVLLIDDRYGEPGMKLLFPPHWKHMRYTGDIESLRYLLEDFWDGK